MASIGEGFARGLQPLVQLKLAENLNQKKNDLAEIGSFLKIIDIPDPAVRDVMVNQFLRATNKDPNDPMFKDLRGVLKKNDEESLALVKRSIAAHGNKGLPLSQQFELLQKDPVKFMQDLETKETLNEVNLAGPPPQNPIQRARELEARAATIPNDRASKIYQGS